MQDYFITDAPSLPQPTRALDTRMSEFALESPEFGDIVGLLTEQSAGDGLLVQVNDFYRDAIREQLAAAEGGMRLEHFACGVTLCIGEIDASSDNDEWLAWQELFDKDARTTASMWSEYSFDDDVARLSRHRFMFVIDPAINVGVVRFGSNMVSPIIREVA